MQKRENDFENIKLIVHIDNKKLDIHYSDCYNCFKFLSNLISDKRYLLRSIGMYGPPDFLPGGMVYAED